MNNNIIKIANRIAKKIGATVKRDKDGRTVRILFNESQRMGLTSFNENKRRIFSAWVERGKAMRGGSTIIDWSGEITSERRFKSAVSLMAMEWGTAPK